MSRELSLVEQLAYSTVRVVADGKTFGTGFLMRFKESDSQYVPVLITNGHVLDGAKEVSFRCTIAAEDGPGSGIYPIKMTVDPNMVAYLPCYRAGTDSDVCALPFAPVINSARKQGVDLFVPMLGMDMLADDGYLGELMQLDEITMIGYPRGIMDEGNNQPIFRRGVLATSPGMDYNNRKEFLTDIATIGGSSGSPVFIIHEGFVHNRRSGGIRVGGGIECKLIGVHRGGFRYDAQGQIVEIVPEEIKAGAYVSITRVPINLGIVIKPNRIRELESLF